MKRRAVTSEVSQLGCPIAKKIVMDEDARWKCPFVGHQHLQGWQRKERLQTHLCVQHGMMTDASLPEYVNLSSLRQASVDERIRYQGLWGRAQAQRLQISSLSVTSIVNSIIRTPGPRRDER